MRTFGSILFVLAAIDFVTSLVGINLTPFLPNEIARFSPIAIGGLGWIFIKIADSNENK